MLQRSCVPSQFLTEYHRKLQNLGLRWKPCRIPFSRAKPVSQRAEIPLDSLSLTRSGAGYDYRVAKDAQTSSEMSPMLLLSAKVSMLLNFFLGEAPTGGFFRNGGSTG